MFEYNKPASDKPEEIPWTGERPGTAGLKHADSLASRLSPQATDGAAEGVEAWDEEVQPVTADPAEGSGQSQPSEPSIFAIGPISVREAAESAKTRVPADRPIDNTPSTPHEERMAELRSWLFGQVGHLQDVSGVRTETADRFLEALGLQPKGDYLILNKTDKPELNKALAEIGFEHSPPTSYYHQILGLRVIYRTPDESVTKIERVYLHESGHATQRILPASARFVLPNVSHWTLSPRLGALSGGFGGPQVGDGGEEGLATWLDTHGIDAIGTNNDVPPHIERLFPSGLPDRYLLGRSFFTHYYAYTALCFDVMFAKDEALMDAVLESRSQPFAMQEVKDRINNFSPGLFDSFMRIQQEHPPATVTPDEHRTIYARNKDTFRHGLHIVLQSTGTPRGELPELSDAAHEQVQKKLREHERKTGFLFR